MTADDVLEVAGPDAERSELFDVVTIDLPAERWSAAALALHDDPRTRLGYFDWLSAYDDKDRGIAVVARLWSVAAKFGVIIRTHVLREGGHIASLTPVWAGADWHERETREMFGIEFDGHPNPLPLLLPDGFDGHPLRKEFVLATRVAKEWPGAKEPGETTTGSTRARRAVRPPGVPDPGTWGPA